VRPIVVHERAVLMAADQGMPAASPDHVGARPGIQSLAGGGARGQVLPADVVARAEAEVTGLRGATAETAQAQPEPPLGGVGGPLDPQAGVEDVGAVAVLVLVDGDGIGQRRAGAPRAQRRPARTARASRSRRRMGSSFPRPGARPVVPELPDPRDLTVPPDSYKSPYTGKGLAGPEGSITNPASATEGVSCRNHPRAGHHHNSSRTKGSPRAPGSHQVPGRRRGGRPNSPSSGRLHSRRDGAAGCSCGSSWPSTRCSWSGSSAPLGPVRPVRG
jgi:hypothetical protein